MLAGVLIIALTNIKWLGIILTVVGGLFCLLLVVMYFMVRNSAIKQNNFGDRKIEYGRNVKGDFVIKEIND